MERLFTINETWLECIGCGHRADLLKERNFRCPECGDLYDIAHNFGLFSLGFFIDLFEKRSITPPRFFNHYPTYVSGIWRFKEWIMPFLPNEYIVTLGEGNVPIVSAGKNLQAWLGDIEAWIILEGMTPTGSFKDFGGTVMMSVAKAAGVKAVACASTGDTSAMAAAYATAAGIKCAVILPKGYVTAVQLAQPLVHGARVITLPGNFDDCMAVMQDLVANYGVYPANSLNPARIEGHQATVFLLAQFFSWRLPDWIAAPVGNGSNCSSIGKGLRLLKFFGLKAKTKILGCQSSAANPLAFSWELYKSAVGFTRTPSDTNLWKGFYQPQEVGETTATAARIGKPVSKDKVMREIVVSEGAMVTASEKDLNEAVAVCGRDGIFVCPQTGTALAGVKDAVAKGLIKKGEKVVVVSTATGLKFAESAAAHLQDTIVEAKNCETDTVAKILDL